LALDATRAQAKNATGAKLESTRMESESRARVPDYYILCTGIMSSRVALMVNVVLCGWLAVEAAEEKLVDATEQAINLMRSVLENPEPIKNLHALLQAQQAFYAEASEAISSVLGEVEEAGTAAEADWRCVRAPVWTMLRDPYSRREIFRESEGS
jgi:hypothetical protein